MNETKLTPEQETKLKQLKMLQVQSMFHKPTPPHGIKSRGVRITRKDKTLNKKKLAISKNSAKINRIKKRHHKTAKEKKSR